MRKTIRKVAQLVGRCIQGFTLGLCITVLFPYACGLLSYGVTYSGCTAEQEWLDEATLYLRALECRAKDPQVKEVLHYTVTRYNTIGPFDVAISRCNWILCVPPGAYVIGINTPTCPGLTLDAEVLSMPVEVGALVLVHEAMHDYYPYFGHSHVTPVMAKVEKLSLDSGTYGTIRFTKRVFN
jgi:hypothetical protein